MTWHEIFRGGPQVDSAGTEHNGDSLIDKALSTFDKGTHEPPVVIGHPTTDAPAYAWVEDLAEGWRDGARTLLARFRDVVPEFADWVRQGFWKKKSAAFYPDGRLRHVGFLGASPPAVKGLADAGFSGGDHFQIEFQEPEKGEPTMSEDQKTFTAADIEAARLEAAEAAKAEAEKQFNEQLRKARVDDSRRQNRNWLDARIKDGVIPPAVKDLGVAQFMDALDVEATFQFADGAVHETPSDWFKRFLDKLFAEEPFASLFREVATHDRAAGTAPREIPDLTGKL